MGLFLDLPNKIKNSGFLILCVLLFFYFSFYTINGERGLLKYMYLSKEIAYAKTIAAQYSAQNTSLKPRFACFLPPAWTWICSTNGPAWF